MQSIENRTFGIVIEAILIDLKNGVVEDRELMELCLRLKEEDFKPELLKYGNVPMVSR